MYMTNIFPLFLTCFFTFQELNTQTNGLKYFLTMHTVSQSQNFQMLLIQLCTFYTRRSTASTIYTKYKCQSHKHKQEILYDAPQKLNVFNFYFIFLHSIALKFCFFPSLKSRFCLSSIGYSETLSSKLIGKNGYIGIGSFRPFST